MRYWIKLYHEILHDPKMGVLSDTLWRRVIELFLIAGEYGGENKDGLLPPVAEIAWILHQPTEKVEEELTSLSTTGIIRRTEDGRWRVVNFAARQSATPDSVRQRLRRTKTRNPIVSRNVTENVTKRDKKMSRNVTKNVQEDRRQKTEDLNVVVVVGGDAQNGEVDEKVRAVFGAYEKEIGALTPGITASIEAAIEKYPLEWILRAINEAALSNVRRWRYVEGILRNWQTAGFETRKKPATRHSHNAEVVKEILEESS